MFMCLRSSLWVLLLHGLTTVSCLDQVKGQVGEDVLLPCVYREDDPLPQEVSVYWRDKDDAEVLDSVLGVLALATQSEIYRGRVALAPPRERDDFSIVLRDVRRSDSGVFDCHLQEQDFKKSVQLIVTDPVVPVADKPNVVTTTQPPGSNAAASLTRPLLPLLPLLLSLYWLV
ncbi:junctional adhesion molecule-like [Limanda limanda]|uniref:junctional adhesion molecule-like n=1 Tax=Limanda limanda TaxID=27771 RepID=UPI0029C967E0|nr:junctional adhesion molecule-like [Limanda limanda]